MSSPRQACTAVHDLGQTSILQLLRCRVDAHVAARRDDHHYGEESSLSDNEQDAEESDGEDGEFGTLEAVERADIYRMDDDLYV
jgi:hypothetical protein